MLGFLPLSAAPLCVATLGNTGRLILTEDADTILSTGILLIQGSASLTEDPDTANSAGGNFVLAYADITEDDDALLSAALRQRFINITTSRPITAATITTNYN